jgi:glycosyltransferase involved in cell wall biosynthesis
MKTMANVKVSVIVPSYKRTVDIVGRAVKSLFNQTYTNLEIIIIDDNAKEELSSYR